VISLFAYPFLVAGIVLLPNRPQHLVVRTRLVLDTLSMMVAGVAVSGYFPLGPMVMPRTQSVFATIVLLAHPEADLVVLACLVMVLLRIDDLSVRRPV
jgi:hypothetical protein